MDNNLESDVEKGVSTRQTDERPKFRNEKVRRVPIINLKLDRMSTSNSPRNFVKSECYNYCTTEQSCATGRSESEYKLRKWLNDLGCVQYTRVYAENGFGRLTDLLAKHKTDSFSVDEVQNMLDCNTGQAVKIVVKLDYDTGKTTEDLRWKLSNSVFESGNMGLKYSVDYTFKECCAFEEEQLVDITKYFASLDLTSWLKKLDLLNLKLNFVKNGFDNVQLLVMQMLSSVPMNETMLEEDLKIYDRSKRQRIIIQLKKEADLLGKLAKGEQFAKIEGYSQSYCAVF